MRDVNRVRSGWHHHMSKEEWFKRSSGGGSRRVRGVKWRKKEARGELRFRVIPKCKSYALCWTCQPPSFRECVFVCVPWQRQQLRLQGSVPVPLVGDCLECRLTTNLCETAAHLHTCASKWAEYLSSVAHPTVTFPQSWTPFICICYHLTVSKFLSVSVIYLLTRFAHISEMGKFPGYLALKLFN